MLSYKGINNYLSGTKGELSIKDVVEFVEKHNECTLNPLFKEYLSIVIKENSKKEFKGSIITLSTAFIKFMDFTEEVKGFNGLSDYLSKEKTKDSRDKNKKLMEESYGGNIAKLNEIIKAITLDNMTDEMKEYNSNLLSLMNIKFPIFPELEKQKTLKVVKFDKISTGMIKLDDKSFGYTLLRFIELAHNDTNINQMRSLFMGILLINKYDI